MIGRKLAIAIIILLICKTGFAQNHIIDSVKTFLKTAKEDTNKVDALNYISRQLYQIGKSDTAFICADNAKKISEKIDYKQGIAGAYQTLGIIYYLEGNYLDALKSYTVSLKVREEMGDKKGFADAYNNIGLIYEKQGNYPDALKKHFASLGIREGLGDKKGVADSYNNIGNIYSKQSNYPDALKNYSSSLKVREELGDKKGMTASYNNIGTIYYYLGNFPAALKYYFTALEIQQELGDKQGIARSYNNIGNIYYYQGKYPDASINFQTSLKIKQEIEDRYGMGTSYINLGNVELKLNQIDKAKRYYQDALAVSKEVGSLDDIKDSYAGLAKTDSAQGNYKGAFENHKLFIAYRDSLNNEETTRKQTQLEMQYGFDKKETEARAEQEKKDTVAEAAKQKQRTILILISCVLALVVVFALFVFRSLGVARRQKDIIKLQKELVEEKHKEITDSINYAERIQRSFLATTGLLNEHLPEHFVFFQPKDVVSGDFYWAATVSNGNFALLTADSTGHGVPGAIMSILNVSAVEKAVDQGLCMPSDILNSTRKTIIQRLKKDGSAEGGKDGMDCSLVCFDMEHKLIRYGAANNPVWLLRGQSITELTRDKMPVGKHDKDHQSFAQHEVRIEKGDQLYTFTDGFPDQFGGPQGKKFMYKQLKELLIRISHLSMNEQQEALKTALNTWKGNLEQVDDICLIGVRV